jgi:hypothetical protein
LIKDKRYKKKKRRKKSLVLEEMDLKTKPHDDVKVHNGLPCQHACVLHGFFG